MPKIHPNAVVPTALDLPQLSGTAGTYRDEVAALTVWRKSLLFNCSGFTVYDAKGNLVFRVDNYVSGSKAELVLMDAAGKPLLTLRRKRMSLGESWSIYNGEGFSGKPLFAVKRRVNLRHAKAPLAHVVPCGGAAAEGGGGYEIEGSYQRRSCKIYDGERSRAVAEIRRKEAKGGVALGDDVFTLVVQPEIDTSLAMGIVLALDQMYG